MRQLAQIRREDGTFTRQRPVWTPDSWGAGYVDSRGYFRVFRPDCPRAWGDGYAMRYHVVWWLTTGLVPAEDLHHKDENKLNDCYENLESKSHSEHTRDHNRLPPVVRTCLNCGRAFGVSRKRGSDPSRGKFCGQVCYHAKPRERGHREAIAAGLRNAYLMGRR